MASYFPVLIGAVTGIVVLIIVPICMVRYMKVGRTMSGEGVPRKSEVPPYLRPGFQRVLSLFLFAACAAIIVANHFLSMAMPGPTLPEMLLAFVMGAGLGLTTLRLRIKQIDALQRGLRPSLVEQLISMIPLVILILVTVAGLLAVLIAHNRSGSVLPILAGSGCMLTWGALPVYLWYRSLPE